MTRKKVNLTYITSDSKRKATFKKRKSDLIKKINEISTVCGIDACAIIYRYSLNEPQPEVWPPHIRVRRVVSNFRRMPQHKQTKKMLNQERFLRQSIMKNKQQLKKQKGETRQKKMSLLMFQCLSTRNVVNNVNINDMADLTWMIDQTIKNIERKNTSIESLEETPMVANGSEAMCVGDRVQQMMETNVHAMQNQHSSMGSRLKQWRWECFI